MKNLIFEMKHVNWSMHKQGECNSSVFKIYDDLSFDIIDDYQIEIMPKINLPEKKIEQEDFELLKTSIEKSKSINIKVIASDGDAWEFICYKDNKVNWKRDMDYIYGIDVLEKIVNILEKYHNEL